MSLAIIIGEGLIILIVFYIGIKHGRKLFSKKEDKKTNGVDTE